MNREQHIVLYDRHFSGWQLIDKVNMPISPENQKVNKPVYETYMTATWGRGSEVLQALWEESISWIPGTTP